MPMTEVFRVVESPNGTYAFVEILIAEPDSDLHRKVEDAVRFCPNRALEIHS